MTKRSCGTDCASLIRPLTLTAQPRAGALGIGPSGAEQSPAQGVTLGDLTTGRSTPQKAMRNQPRAGALGIGPSGAEQSPAQV